MTRMKCLRRRHRRTVERRSRRFCPTEWDSSEQKAKFVKHFIRFVDKDFKQTLFYRWFYRRLSNTFGHIAHYSVHGFFAEFFTNAADIVRFLKMTLEYPCCGSSRYTYSDAEQRIQELIRMGGFLEKYERLLAREIETKERAELVRLQTKYHVLEPQ